MRITKVKVGKEDVVIKRNAKEGYLLVGNEEKRGVSTTDPQGINRFILNDKSASLSLSLQNTILVRDDHFDKSQDKKRQCDKLKLLKKLFNNFILKQLNKDAEYKVDPALKGLSEKELSKYVKYSFRKTTAGAEYSQYIVELAEALNADRLTKNSLPHFKAWIDKRLERIERISNSIHRNKINIAIDGANGNGAPSSKRKQFLQDCFKDISNFSQKINKAKRLYKLEELCAGLQDISIWYNEGEGKKEQGLGKKYKVYLQKTHQPKIFGTRDNPINREDPLLYVYHNEFVAYLKSKFPLNSKKGYEEEYVKTFLHVDKLHAILSNQVRNKLIQHIISNGKLVHNKITAKIAKGEELPYFFSEQELNEGLNSNLLQAIKVKETFKRSLTDSIVFAANQLRNRVGVHIPKGFIDAVNTGTFIDFKRPANTEELEKLRAHLEGLIGLSKHIYGFDYSKIKQIYKMLEKVKLDSNEGKTEFFNDSKIRNLCKDLENRFKILKVDASKPVDEQIEYISAYKKLFDDDFLNVANTSWKKLLPLHTCSSDEQDVIEYQHSSLFALRNAIFHVQKLQKLSVQDANENILQHLQKDIANLKRAVIEKLYSTNILAYYAKPNLKIIFKDELDFSTPSVAFAPSFHNVLERARNLQKSNEYQDNNQLKWAPVKERKNETEIEQRNAKNTAQSYLLEIIYYNYFLGGFVNNRGAFYTAVEKVKERTNKITGTEGSNDKKAGRGYTDLLKISTTQSVSCYLAEVQAEEQKRLSIQEDAKLEAKQTKEQPFFQRFIRDIFVEGFSAFLQHNNMLKLVLSISEAPVLPDKKYSFDDAVKDFGNVIRIKHIEQFRSAQDSVFYSWVLLLDNAQLNVLKGNVLKYSQAQKTMPSLTYPFDYSPEKLLTLINIRSALSPLAEVTHEEQKEKQEKDPINISEDIKLKLLSNFVNFNFVEGDDVTSLADLRNFEPQTLGEGLRQQMYLSNEKVIEKSSLLQLQKQNLMLLFEKLNLPKVELADCEKFYAQEQHINEYTVLQEQKHKAWQTYKEKFTGALKYQETVENISNYMWYKNKVDLVYAQRLGRLVQNILGSFISKAYLFERDLNYIFLALLNHKKLLCNTCNSRYGFETGKITFFKKALNSENSDIKETANATLNLLNHTEDSFYKALGIRNYLAHDHYTRCMKLTRKDEEGDFSLLDMLCHLRSLMAYDRKLKNAVAKSFIDLLKKHGIVITFKPLHENEHKFSIKTIQPDTITHLGGMKFKGVNNKEQSVTTDKVHKEYVAMVKALLEFKSNT